MNTDTLSTDLLPDCQILLFGFSRGAYAARMVAGIINEIGILDRVSEPPVTASLVAQD